MNNVDANFILEQIAANKWGWLRIKRFKPEDYATIEERYAALERHHVEETGTLIATLTKLCTQHKEMSEAVKKVVTQRGDDICWRDVYTELAKLVGIDFCPELIEGKEKMLANCHCFLDSLYGGEYVPVYVEKRIRTPYQTSGPDIYSTSMIRAVTDDFVRAYGSLREFDSDFFRHLHASRMLPGGVDINRPDVIEILTRLDEWMEKHGKSNI